MRAPGAWRWLPAIAAVIVLGGCVQLLDGDRDYRLLGTGGAGSGTGEATSTTSGEGGRGGAATTTGSGAGLPCSSTKWVSPTAVGTVQAHSALDFGPTSSFSIAFWASLGSSRMQHLAVKGNNGTHEWSITYDNLAHLFCVNRQDVAELLCVAVPAGAWHHYLVTYDKGVVTVYLDGSKIGGASGKIGNAQLTPLYIGNFPGTENSVDGLLDDVALWGLSLQPADVLGLHQRTKKPADFTPLLARWTFDEGQGSAAADDSGNGHVMALQEVDWSADCAP